MLTMEVAVVANPYPTKVLKTAYPSYDDVVFPNTVSPNAAGHATPIPRNTFGNVSLPIFDKQAASKLPSAAIVIRNLIRGNSS